MDEALEQRWSRVRHCPICKTRLQGRIDKKFCSARCKLFYHRQLRKVTQNVVTDIDKILHRNRSILLEVMGKRRGELKIDRLELEHRKFNFNYFTNTVVNSKGKTYHYVYDIAWMTFSTNEVYLLRPSRRQRLK